MLHPVGGPHAAGVRALADERGIAFAGQDGKTGETLLRTAIAPMFVARGMHVHSWAGANLLGGGDGATLADPEAVRSKLASKTRGLRSLVGEHVVAPLHIDNVPDLGDIKTAWDHIHAEGFLGSRITMQTIWSAYDSMLAAPLILDIARLLALAEAAGVRGVVPELGFFFKDPWGSDVHDFSRADHRTVRVGARHRRARRDRATARSRGARAMTTAGDVLELVRAPAALTVLGDTIAGGHAGGARFTGRQWLLPLASVFLYSGGMALNDYADRDLDAVERPERPIPSGRVPARRALGIAAALMAAGVGLAAAGGGRRSLGVAAPLVGAIVLYNTVAKDTAAGPVSMAACRGLDVLMGGGGARAALPAAATVALHTAGVTATSQGEVHGGSVGTARAGLAITGVTALAAVAGIGPGRRPATSSSRTNSVGRGHRVVSLLAAVAGAAAYLATTLPSQTKTLGDPSATNARTATRAGIGAMVPLQAALTARSGALGPAALLAGVDVARRALSARRSRGDVT